MSKLRILLLCTQPLLGEGLAAILGQESEFDLLGPFVLAGDALARIADSCPDAVLTAEGEKEDRAVTRANGHGVVDVVRPTANWPQATLYKSEVVTISARPRRPKL